MVSQKSAIAWFVILLVLCSISSYQIKNHWRIQTDILALLPQDEREPMVQTIRRMVSGELGRTALFLVSHAQPHMARDATRHLGKLMDASRVFSVVLWDYSNQPKAFFAFYFPLRYRFISPNLRPYLDRDDGYQYFIDRLKIELYQPMSSFVTRFLEGDPLLFFPELMKEFGKNLMQINHVGGIGGISVAENSSFNKEKIKEDIEKKISIEDGMLGTMYNGRHYYFIIAQIASNPFEENIQTQLEESWQTWSHELRRTFPELELTYTAVARFASSMRNNMQKDMSFISIGSTLSIIFLIIMTFRSVKQLFIALLPLLLGLWNALGLSLLLFDELHAFTLVFGASLIGVCIDYSLFYFAHHRVARQWESIRTMLDILPALSLGALTTVMSYIDKLLFLLRVVSSSLFLRSSFGSLSYCEFPILLRLMRRSFTKD